MAGGVAFFERMEVKDLLAYLRLLANSTIDYVGLLGPAPRRELMLLKPLVEEVADSQGLPREGSIAFIADIDANLRVVLSKFLRALIRKLYMIWTKP